MNYTIKKLEDKQSRADLYTYSKFNSDSRYLLSVDPSLTSSGWALFSISTGSPKRVGIIKSLGTKYSLSDRLSVIQSDVSLLIQELSLKSSDYLVCEGPAPILLNPKTSIKVERVRGIFEAVARTNSVSVPGRINPRTVHVEVLGMYGKQLDRQSVKMSARKTAFTLYTNELKEILGEKYKNTSQDIIDALLIGTVAVSRLKYCIQTNSDVSDSFEITKSKFVSYDLNRKTKSSKGNRNSWENYFKNRI